MAILLTFIVFILLFLAGMIFLSFSLLGFRDFLFTDVPFVSTKKRAIEPIIKALSLSRGSILYELGCGKANILKSAIKKTSGAKGIGIEKGYLPYLFSLINTRDLSISIYYRDIVSTNLSDATHIYCYLCNSLMEILSKKILSECRVGTRIVSCDFLLPNIPLMQTIPLEAGKDKLSRTLYVYETK